ncbi:TetR/AcrR family transcriptional regulator [Candidatus Parcubacteria bacterium]|nr:MAG: TetR/AcrR family transcriptional regulator [Candidatus Parcubacteria bacterium]
MAIPVDNVNMKCWIAVMNGKASLKYHHGDLRAALIEAAADMVQREGVGAVTMRRLSDAVGVSHAAPYRHFEDKAALLTAVAIEGFRRFGQVLREARCDAASKTIDRFRAMGRAYLRFVMENTAYYRLMFGQGPLRECPELREAADAAFSELTEAIERLQRKGLIRQDDPRAQAIFVWSIMHGFSLLVVDGKLRECSGGGEGVFASIEKLSLRALGYTGAVGRGAAVDGGLP